MRRLLMLLGAVLLLLGCQEIPPPEKTVFEPYKQAVKKAKTVEGALAQAAERRAEEAEQAEAKSPY